MIPMSSITKWRNHAPWITDEQVEQDLVLSRILVELFSNPFLSKELAFRGGTALHKLFFNPPARYSEDIDLVRITVGPIGEIIDTIKDILNRWLDKPFSRERNENGFRLDYRFEAEAPTTSLMRVKIEINTRECEPLFKIQDKLFSLENPWFSGKANIQTYCLEELLGTKLRALYQRKKGRDLFDLSMALETFPNLDINKVMQSFEFYLAKENKIVTGAQFKENLDTKINDPVFLNDIKLFLSSNIRFPITFPATFKENFDIKVAANNIEKIFFARLRS